LVNDYKELFDERGSAYDRAMQRFPEARAAEFAQVIAAANVLPGMTVADVPAGGGYLARHLPHGCTWLGHEPCASFTNHGDPASSGPPLLPLPWPPAHVDAIISLAGLHHIENKRPLFEECGRVLKPSGLFVVSDVASGSAVANFLDGYVGAHNSTGHEGIFLDEGTITELKQTGWNIVSIQQNDFHWVFEDRAAMAAFCHNLFDIRKATIEQTLSSIEQELGVDPMPDGRIGMRWSLMTIIARL
jgi:SAM-dependent methyltransferase